MPVHSNEFENVCFNALLHNLIIKIGEITKIANSKKKKNTLAKKLHATAERKEKYSQLIL